MEKSVTGPTRIHSSGNASHRMVGQSRHKSEDQQQGEDRHQKHGEVAQGAASLFVDECKNVFVLDGEAANMTAVGASAVDPTSCGRSRMENYSTPTRPLCFPHRWERIADVLSLK